MILKQIGFNEAFELAKNGEEAVFILSISEDLNRARVKTLKNMTIGELNKRKVDGHIAFKLEGGEFDED